MQYIRFTKVGSATPTSFGENSIQYSEPQRVNVSEYKINAKMLPMDRDKFYRLHNDSRIDIYYSLV